MSHIYTLNPDGSANRPITQPHLVRVEEPRRLQLKGLGLRLPETEPDLPVGKEVMVWKDDWFHCESIEADDEKRIKAKPNKFTPAFSKQNQPNYIADTQAVLRKSPNADTLRAHLEYLRLTRVSHQLRIKKFKKKSAEDRQKREESHAHTSAIDVAITLVSKHLVMRLGEMGIPGGAAYAYGPREGVHYDVHTLGRDHFQLALPLVHGRLVRQMGDLMCKPSREFWGLRVTEDPYHISCWACLKRMLSLLENSPGNN